MHVLVIRFLSFLVCLFIQKIEAGRCHDRIRGENFIWLGKRLHRKQTVKSDGNNLDQPKFSWYIWRLQSYNSSFEVVVGRCLNCFIFLFLIQTGYWWNSTTTTAAANPVESRLDTIQWRHTNFVTILVFYHFIKNWLIKVNILASQVKHLHLPQHS